MTLKPRKFADFRQGVIERPPAEDEPIDRVVMRLFTASPDGLRVLGWMLAETAKPCPAGADDRALRESEGARRFVATVHQMAQGSYVPRPNS